MRYAPIFGSNALISQGEKDRVISELQKIGSLTFSIHTSDDGWYAECTEAPGILAANTTKNPSEEEIQDEIREAIFSAFNVKLEEPETVLASGNLVCFSYDLTSGELAR